MSGLTLGDYFNIDSPLDKLKLPNDYFKMKSYEPK